MISEIISSLAFKEIGSFSLSLRLLNVFFNVVMNFMSPPGPYEDHIFTSHCLYHRERNMSIGLITVIV
jgi:hypothetical protein